ncbi:unnamed protein product [Nippostrongylus brasiliensis]|uniref:NAC domain-containing protein n=1 Tax=Nippostrongylus brasiliensis TaxID=27835 RepID=A0A0N4Y6D2_NIPBR|nr:unnamed protein product [Nippostrongylus brasiliensis]
MKIMVVTKNERLHFFTVYARRQVAPNSKKRWIQLPWWFWLPETAARNDDGERILEYYCPHDLVIANTTFRKRPSHLISFYKEKEAEVIGGIRLPPIVDVDSTWQNMKTVVYEAAWSLGMTKPGRRMIGRQTWLRTDEVKEKDRSKNRLYKAVLCNETATKWSAYSEARTAANEIISTEEFPHSPLPHANPITGPILPISAEEVVLTLTNVNTGKVTGPDDVAVELYLWTSISEYQFDILFVQQDNEHSEI